MKIKEMWLIALVTTIIFYSSCSNGDDIPKTLLPPNGAKELLKIEQALASKDQDFVDLLNKVRGSVGKLGPGSKTIWSRKNDYGLGLYISANHVYGINGWNSRSPEFFDITEENKGIFEGSQIPPKNGAVELGKTLIADFPLMHFEISSLATNTTILPIEDFYFGVVDNQKVEQGAFPQYPSTVKTNVQLDMYDPSNRTLALQTWSNPEPGTKAMLIGYPQDSEAYPNGSVAMGNILTDAEAVSALKILKDAGDEEGDVPYNGNVEFLVQAKAIAGMSGGGVFNNSGKLLGVMVRASTSSNAKNIVRVVKMDYIRNKMIDFFNSLSSSNKEIIGPFISGEI